MTVQEVTRNLQTTTLEHPDTLEHFEIIYLIACRVFAVAVNETVAMKSIERTIVVLALADFLLRDPVNFLCRPLDESARRRLALGMVVLIASSVAFGGIALDLLKGNELLALGGWILLKGYSNAIRGNGQRQLQR